MTSEEYAARYTQAYTDTRNQLLARGEHKFVEVSEAMYAEFKAKAGMVTCEHSTRGIHLDIKMKFLALMSMQDSIYTGYWTVGWCPRCEELHGGKRSYHCEIVKSKR